jgi:enoyl-CoA hydratase
LGGTARQWSKEQTVSPSDVLIEQDGPRLILTFRRADKLNAINESIEQGIAEAVGRLESDPSVRVLLIRAEGDYFSAGYDVAYRVDDAFDVGGIALRRRYREIHDLFDRIEQVEKPVVLAAQGPCLGGALELAMSCDFRLASERATFSFPEIGLGVLPGSGGTSRTTRLVGPAAARWLVMAARPVDAARALQLGLVHDVHPHDEFDTLVEAFVGDLVRLPSEALGVAKLSIGLCDVLDPSSARAVERIANSLLLPSDEHQRLLGEIKDRLSRSNRFP